MRKFQLSEEAIVAHAGIAILFLDISEHLNIDGQETRHFLLKKALEKAKQEDNYSKMEDIAIYFMVEQNIHTFFLGSYNPNTLRRGGIGRDINEILDWVDEEALASIHDGVREFMRATFSHHIADLNFFIEQEYFDEDLEEPFFDYILETFDHNFFNRDYLESHRAQILGWFDDSFMREALQNRETPRDGESRKKVIDTIMQDLIW